MECRQDPRQSSSLRAGIITETSGALLPCSPGCCFESVGDLSIRIVYYSFVKHLTWLTLLLAGLLSGCYSGTRPPGIGTPAPDFTVQDSERAVSLHDLHGKVVVLNFWATWCGPCVEEMPSLVAMQSKMKGSVTVLAVNLDVDESAYRRFLKDHGIDLLTVRDPDKKSSELYEIGRASCRERV